MEKEKKNWSVEPLSPWELAIVDENEDEIFLKPLTQDVVTEKDWETFQLASAAPELLEALKECINAMEYGDPKEETTSLAWNRVIFNGRKAVNKALGIKE